jgi:hypothetical protein
MARFAVLLVGVIALTCLWMLFRDEDEEPTQADRIIAYCQDRVNRSSPLCRIDPDDKDAVKDAVEDLLRRNTTTPPPRVIERNNTIRENRDSSDDEDDDETAPRVQVNVPRQTNPPSRTPTTRPPTSTPSPRPLLPEPDLPDLPDPPELPDLGFPLLP